MGQLILQSVNFRFDTRFYLKKYKRSDRGRHPTLTSGYYKYSQKVSSKKERNIYKNAAQLTACLGSMQKGLDSISSTA